MKQELIEFDLAGLTLQEPMALITNWMMSVFCLYAYFKLRNTTEIDAVWWKRFFLVFTISTFFGGIGHLFFKYFGIPGKFPNWITGIMSGYFAGKGMLVHFAEDRNRRWLDLFLPVKAIVLLGLALSLQKFIFIAVDAIITYIIYCGGIGWILYKRGFTEMKFMTYGVLICLPSVFIFLLKLNVHRWLNKDDLSHLLMLSCLICFYIGASARMRLKTTSIS